MKKIVFNSILISGLLALTSCLGDPATNFTTYNAPGVVKVISGTPGKVIFVKGGQIISSEEFQKEKVEDGECILLDYSIDYSAGENTNGGAQNGYMTATIYTQSITKVPNRPLLPTLTDTAVVQKNEQTVSALHPRFAYIRGNFFLFTQMANHGINQVDSFSLSYNSKAVPGNDIYELYLRAILKEKDESKASSMIIPCAFDIHDFIKKAGGTESNPKDVKFRVHYVTGFSKDSTACIWKASDVFTVNTSEKKTNE